MINDLLFAFFVGMPPVVAMVLARDMRTHWTRAALFWGGAAATCLAALLLVPILLCKGTLLTGYAACAGGTAVTEALNAAQPAIRGGTFVYILVGPPLAAAIVLLDWLASRRKSTPEQ